MQVRFEDDELAAAEQDRRRSAGRGAAIDKAFRRRMQQIRAAVDERDLRLHKSLHFEKLKGSRQDQHSIRLNDQWRLIVRLEGQGPQKVMAIVAIGDYH